LNIFCIPAADENGADDTIGLKIRVFPLPCSWLEDVLWPNTY